MQTTIQVIRSGRHWEIVSLAQANGNEVAEFLEALPLRAEKKIVRLFQTIVDDKDGPFVFRSEQKMRHLGDDVYELKSDQVRLLFFIDQPRRIIVATGFLKRTQKTPRRELDRARSARVQYFGEAK